MKANQDTESINAHGRRYLLINTSIQWANRWRCFSSLFEVVSHGRLWGLWQSFTLKTHSGPQRNWECREKPKAEETVGGMPLLKQTRFHLILPTSLVDIEGARSKQVESFYSHFVFFLLSVSACDALITRSVIDWERLKQRTEDTERLLLSQLRHSEMRCAFFFLFPLQSQEE